jgi:hypothetical protein
MGAFFLINYQRKSLQHIECYGLLFTNSPIAVKTELFNKRYFFCITDSQ